MKKIKLFAFLMLVVSLLLTGITGVNAQNSIPDSVVSDNYKIIEYIDNFRVVVKTGDDGKYYLYCINMEATYDKGITFLKQTTVNPGFLYILNNKPNTGDKDKDFYITQMAVWYYEDYLNQNNANLETAVKKYIVAHKDTEEVSKKIIELLNGAQTYTQQDGVLALGKENITFTEKDGYFVSSEISVTTRNLTGNLKYSLTNTPVGSKVVKSGNGVKVKIPVEAIKEGNQLRFSLNVSGQYSKQEAYYYYHSSKYQRVLFSEPLEKLITVSDSVNMIVRRYPDDHLVEISKTDVTQSKEIEGATLTIKDSAGKVIDSWVSGKETRKIKLKSGEYALNETIAPKGYKLSTTTVYFKVDETGKVFVKNDKGNYVEVNKVVMINELIEIDISKTDVTQSKEVEGATLTIKDSTDKVIETWVSGKEPKKVKLNSGEYALNETIAPEGYRLSSTTINFKVDEYGKVFVKNDKGNYVEVNKVVMINELLDVVSFAKKDSKTDSYLAGATMQIKDEAGNVIHEFISQDTIYQFQLNVGKYTLSESKSPEGYLLSNEVIEFEILNDGTLKVKNNNGEYADSAIIVFYNTPEETVEVPVPPTDSNNTLLIIGGVALLIGGIVCVRKTIKEC